MTPACDGRTSLRSRRHIPRLNKKSCEEDDLMSWDVLNAIERAAIRHENSPIEVFELISGSFLNYTSRQLGAWVEYFFLLWCRSQWKRERYASSFHPMTRTLTRSVVSFSDSIGGFEVELVE